MKLVYIAGPFRGKTAWDIESNVRKAESLALTVALAGALPICPHANSRFFHGQLQDNFWCDGYLDLVRRCDAVMTTRDWHISDGAKAEVEVATRRGIPVFHDHDEAAGGWGRFYEWMKDD